MVSFKYDKNRNNAHIGMGGKSPANRKSSGTRPAAELTQKREVIIYDLAAEGKSLREIATILNSEKYNLGPITFQGVGKALHRINDRELAKLTEMVKHEKIMQTNSLRLIFRESMSAWKRSKEAGKRVRKRIKEGFERDKLGADGKPQYNPPHAETSTELIEQNGDPRFLAQARETLADIRKIWGIDAPTKHAHTDPSGENEFGGMTPEERADRLAEMIDIIRARIPENERNGETLALEAPQDDEPELEEEDDDDLGEEYEPDVIDAEGFPSEGENDVNDSES